MTGRSTRTARRSTASSAARPTARPSSPASSSWEPIEGLVIPRAEELGRAGRWAEAAGLLARCGRTGPLSRELAQAWGIACLKAGDRAGYREACAAVMACQGPDPTVVWNALTRRRSWPWGAGAWTTTASPIAMVREPAVRRSRAAPHLSAPYYFPNALGGLLAPRRPDRRGDRPPERGNRPPRRRRSSRITPPTGPTWPWPTRSKGNLAEARRWLDRLRTFAS